MSIAFTWSQKHLDCDINSDSTGQGDSQKAASEKDSPEKEAPKEEAQPAAPGRQSQDERPDHLKWKGREISFMKSNEHSKERQGTWDAGALEGAAKTIVQGDEKGAR